MEEVHLPRVDGAAECKAITADPGGLRFVLCTGITRVMPRRALKELPE